MPVEDLNAVKMGTELLNVIESAETTTEFWKLNSDLISMLFFAILFLGILFAIVVFVRYSIKRSL